MNWVRVGEYDTRHTEDNENGLAKSADYEIEEAFVHPQYVNTSVYYDIALYRLKQDVEFNSFVRPACLQTQHQIRDQHASSTGWGKTGVIGQ